MPKRPGKYVRVLPKPFRETASESNNQSNISPVHNEFYCTAGIAEWRTEKNGREKKIKALKAEKRKELEANGIEIAQVFIEKERKRKSKNHMSAHNSQNGFDKERTVWQLIPKQRSEMRK